MLQKLHIQGYRSLKQLELPFSQLTLIQGANGTGKSNIYRSLELMSSLALGTFAQKISHEGGIKSLQWQGNGAPPSEIFWKLEFDDFSYQISLKPNSHTEEISVFSNDPKIHEENLHWFQRSVAKRKESFVTRWNDKNQIEQNHLPLHATQSILSFSDWVQSFAAVHIFTEKLKNWRFYHEFPCHPNAPARHPQNGTWSPILAADATNLCATIETMREAHSEGFYTLQNILEQTFPDQKIVIPRSQPLQLFWQREGLRHPLPASAISDGTLRFLCFITALCSLQQPPLLILNEPENSLDERLLNPLAQCIAEASKTTQIILVSHSSILASHLRQYSEITHHQLVMDHGATRLVEDLGTRRTWRFD